MITRKIRPKYMATTIIKTGLRNHGRALGSATSGPSHRGSDILAWPTYFESLKWKVWAHGGAKGVVRTHLGSD